MKKIFILLISIILLSSCKVFLKEKTNEDITLISKTELKDCGSIKDGDYKKETFDCFRESYNYCNPAKIKVANDAGSARLEILGYNKEKCQLNYVIEKGTPEKENKNLLCDFDNSISLGIDKEAIVNIMLLPTDMLILAKQGECKGSLLNTSFVK